MPFFFISDEGSSGSKPRDSIVPATYIIHIYHTNLPLVWSECRCALFLGSMPAGYCLIEGSKCMYTADCVRDPAKACHTSSKEAVVVGDQCHHPNEIIINRRLQKNSCPMATITTCSRPEPMDWRGPVRPHLGNAADATLSNFYKPSKTFWLPGLGIFPLRFLEMALGIPGASLPATYMEDPKIWTHVSQKR